jgi:hypothetical protein
MCEQLIPAEDVDLGLLALEKEVFRLIVSGPKSDINSPVSASVRHSANSAAQSSEGQPSGPQGTSPGTQV